MRWTVFSALAIALFISPVGAPSRAEAAPQFSIVQHCAKLARTAGDPETIEAGCRRGEERARSAAAFLERSKPELVSWCAEVAAAGSEASGSYQIYLGCLEAQRKP